MTWAASLTTTIRMHFNRVWNSPTLMTWASFISKPLSLLLLTPMILRTLPVEDSSLWLLFGIYIGFQNLANMGFSSTMVRAFSFAMGGASEIRIFNEGAPDKNVGSPNWGLANAIDSTIVFLYVRLGLVFFFLLGSLGTLSLMTPISRVSGSLEYWISWSIVVIVTTLNVTASRYHIFLRGTNHVALLMRWQSIFSIVSIVSSFIVIFMTKSLMWLIINNQIWVLVNILRNRYLARSVHRGIMQSFIYSGSDKSIMQGTIPSAWRTWLSHLTSFGIVQLSGIIYAQLGNAAEVSSYLFALRIINYITQFANAPFYSKLPLLQNYFIQKSVKLLVVAKKGMRYSLLTFSIAVVMTGVGAQWFLDIVGSNVEFVNTRLWLLMGIGFWFYRYGSMHMQLYSVSNHVISHIGNVGAAIIYIPFSLLLYKHIGIYSFPVSLIVGNVGFFAWYSAKYSYRFHKLKFPDFEMDTSALSLLILGLYALAEILY